jgi:hypothetical protein
MREGGSNKQTGKINATTAECLIVIGVILRDSLYLSSNGTISRDSFAEAVRAAMQTKGQGDLFHVTTAKNKFDNSPELQPFKVPLGRPKKQQ